MSDEIKFKTTPLTVGEMLLVIRVMRDAFDLDASVRLMASRTGRTVESFTDMPMPAFQALYKRLGESFEVLTALDAVGDIIKSGKFNNNAN